MLLVVFKDNPCQLIMNSGRTAVHVSGGRAGRHRLSRGAGAKRAPAVPRPAGTAVRVHMRPGEADKPAHAAPFGRTGKKGRQTCVAGYCARCKSCLLFNKRKITPPSHSFPPREIRACHFAT